ncbi:Unannotated [Lentimonas sp. CC4]|nr:Unannotated [Lentimonas sp. CC4]CAA6685708.1 Unannotated [Lentimonas sp. CC6]CAA7077151.1 Unannotated [Lentimonas sp. CC4]CAA7168765.1 Unannotated [Lentimonas sp. CC21]CAA7180867.1 Unannotated [Lentimonas sp. CC8]
MPCHVAPCLHLLELFLPCSDKNKTTVVMLTLITTVVISYLTKITRRQYTYLKIRHFLGFSNGIFL